MTTKLIISISFDQSVKHYLGKTIDVDQQLATELHIQDGHAGVLQETADELKINYRGASVWLPKNRFQVI